MINRRINSSSIHDMELDGKLELEYELGLGDELGQDCGLEHEKLACELELDDTLGLAYELERDVLVCVLEQEQHSLHMIHLRCSRHNDQQYILHAALYHREDVRCTLH